MGVNEYIKIGSRIKELRIEKGIKQKDMAGMLGVSVSTYSNYENGYREPSMDIIEKAAKILEVKIDELIGRSLTDAYLQAIIKINPSFQSSFDNVRSAAAAVLENELKPDSVLTKVSRYFEKLNSKGKIEAIKRIEELTHIDKYTKEE